MNNNFKRWSDDEKDLVQSTITNAIKASGTKTRVVNEQIQKLARHLGRTDKGVRFMWNALERKRQKMVKPTAVPASEISETNLNADSITAPSIPVVDINQKVAKCVNAISVVDKLQLSEDELAIVFSHFKA